MNKFACLSISMPSDIPFLPAALVVPLEPLQLPLDGAAVPPHGRGHGHHRELDLVSDIAKCHIRGSKL